MAKNSYTYTEAESEAQAGLDAGLAGIEIRSGRLIEQELTVAKIIEIEAQKVEGILSLMGRNKTVTGKTTLDEFYINNAKNALSRASGAKSQINQLDQEIKKEPIEATHLSTLQTRMSNITTNFAEAICSNREAIILFAGVKKHLQDRLNNLPNPLSAHITNPSPFPTNIDDISSFAIEGTKQTDETIEILNSAGQVLGSFGGSGTNFLCDNLQNLKNGRTDITIRVTNPTTKVYRDLKYPVTINTPEAPTLTTPNPMTITGHPSFIEGNIATPGHTVQFLDESGIALTPSVAPTMFGPGNKKFRIQIPETGSGTKRYMIRISNGATQVDEFVSITADLKDLSEKPEGMQDSVEMTQPKQKITLGKIKPGQNMPTNVIIKSKKTPANQIDLPLRKASDGTYYIEMPEKYTSTGTPNLENADHELKFEITDSAGALLRECEMKIKVNIPLKKPEKVGIIKGYDIKHLAEDAKKKDQKYNINGHTHDFIIHKKSWFGEYVAQVPDEHNLLGHGHGIPAVISGTPKENLVSAKNPEELTKKIYERLHHINHHKEVEFNVANGIVTERPETPHEKKEDSEHSEKGKEGKEKEKGKDEKEKGEKKDEHKKEGEHSGSTFDKVIGYIGKKIIGAKNMIPARQFIKGSAKSSAFFATGFGALGLIGGAPLLPALAGGAAVGLVGYTGYRLWRAFFPKKQEEEAPHHA